jgi:photosynthetic reaction center H subunit
MTTTYTGLMLTLMLTGAITSYIDVAQIALYLFWIFFAGLVFYLQRESRREGFPLQNDGSDTPRNAKASFLPEAKTYKLTGGGTVSVPNDKRESQAIKAKRIGPWHGAAHAPTGNPMIDAVGPASYAQRADVPDRMQSGAPRIVPLRADHAYHVDANDTDPVGMAVVGADGVKAGTVKDVWVDRAEAVIRYLEVSSGARSVLLPMNFASKINGAKRTITVNAILGGQFANVPGTKNPDQVTLLEEDKIMGYYGGGLLYATPARAEPLI